MRRECIIAHLNGDVNTICKIVGAFNINILLIY